MQALGDGKTPAHGQVRLNNNLCRCSQNLWLCWHHLPLPPCVAQACALAVVNGVLATGGNGLLGSSVSVLQFLAMAVVGVAGEGNGQPAFLQYFVNNQSY